MNMIVDVNKTTNYDNILCFIKSLVHEQHTTTIPYTSMIATAQRSSGIEILYH